MLNHQLAVVEVGILEVRLAMETLAPMEPHLQVRRRALRVSLCFGFCSVQRLWVA